MSLNSELILKAYHNLDGFLVKTPLQLNENLSEFYGCNIFLKREDLQPVRSYKIRGAYNFLSQLSDEERKKGIVCSSAGNHAQGVAYVCNKLKIKGTIFMPLTTPNQKIYKTKKFGNSWIEIVRIGDSFDEACSTSKKFAEKTGAIYVHPFDDEKVIAGQGTIAVEILNELKKVDYIIVPVGGGGLISGIGLYIKSASPETKIIAVESEDAPSMARAFENNSPVELKTISTFIEGTAVRKIGDITYEIARKVVDKIILVPEGKVCSKMMQLYKEDGIVVEPAGALSVTALDFLKDEIKNKNVVCILSGGNNDWARLNEIEEKSLIYEGLKYYFLIEFAQRAGSLKEFVNKVLNENTDIVRFEYIKKSNKEFGPALVGIQLNKKENYTELIERMNSCGIKYFDLKKESLLFNYIV
jgi:threonine dehydratase